MKKDKQATVSLTPMPESTNSPAEPQSPDRPLTVDEIFKHLKELEALQNQRAELDLKISTVQLLLKSSKKTVDSLFGVQEVAATTTRKRRGKASKGGAGGGGGGGGTQVETAKGVVSKLGDDFTIQNFRDGLKEADLKDANVNYLLQQLKKQKVIKKAGRGKFKKV